MGPKLHRRRPVSLQLCKSISRGHLKKEKFKSKASVGFYQRLTIVASRVTPSYSLHFSVQAPQLPVLIARLPPCLKTFLLQEEEEDRRELELRWQS